MALFLGYGAGYWHMKNDVKKFIVNEVDAENIFFGIFVILMFVN